MADARRRRGLMGHLMGHRMSLARVIPAMARPNAPPHEAHADGWAAARARSWGGLAWRNGFMGRRPAGMGP
ncbi:hypothetical protein AAII07_55320 [Microvirga sp. 0TCS3.31]